MDEGGLKPPSRVSREPCRSNLSAGQGGKTAEESIAPTESSYTRRGKPRRRVGGDIYDRREKEKMRRFRQLRVHRRKRDRGEVINHTVVRMPVYTNIYMCVCVCVCVCLCVCVCVCARIY